MTILTGDGKDGTLMVKIAIREMIKQFHSLLHHHLGQCLLRWEALRLPLLQWRNHAFVGGQTVVLAMTQSNEQKEKKCNG